MGQEHGGPVPDPVDESRAQKVHAQLHAEIERDQKGDSGQGDTVSGLEDKKEQGCEVVDDGLNDVAGKTGFDRMPRIPLFWVSGFHLCHLAS